MQIKLHIIKVTIIHHACYRYYITLKFPIVCSPFHIAKQRNIIVILHSFLPRRIWYTRKPHAGDTTQNIHPPLVQMTHIHIQPHTLHQSYI